jgi:hypothetical protein
MTTTRASLSLAAVTAFAGASVLSGGLAMPMAHADPLDAIIGTVKNDRSKTRCPQYNYSPDLEAAAQTFARSENPVDGQPGNYNGKTLAFLGSGDPQAAATTSAYQRGAGPLISNCQFTDFGVGFIRHEDRSVDVVTIVFGAPAAAPAPAATSAPANTPEPVKTPDPVAAAVAPTDAVQLSFDKGLVWTVNVTNSADIAGNCTYVATNPLLPGANKNFKIGSKGSTSFTVPGPPPLSTYHVVLSCTGPFNGQNVEFGHVEMDVSA